MYKKSGPDHLTVDGECIALGNRFKKQIDVCRRTSIREDVIFFGSLMFLFPWVFFFSSFSTFFA